MRGMSSKVNGRYFARQVQNSEAKVSNESGFDCVKEVVNDNKTRAVSNRRMESQHSTPVGYEPKSNSSTFCRRSAEHSQKSPQNRLAILASDGQFGCAGIKRHVVGDERALRERRVATIPELISSVSPYGANERNTSR